MTRIFISHADEDRVSADMFADYLLRQGYQVFLDFHAQHGIPGGADWESALMDAMRQSSAVLLLVTPALRESQWGFAETVIARYEGKGLIPLLLQGEPHDVWEFLRATTEYIDLRRDPAAGRERLLQALESLGLHPDRTAASHEFEDTRERAPYLGLQPLREDDAAIFFGRTTDVKSLIELLRPRPGGKYPGLLTVLGPSGSGKSSMVHAGLLPRLRRGAVTSSETWLYLSMTPGAAPFRNLAEALRRMTAELGSVRDIERSLEEDSQGISYTFSEILAAHPQSVRILLLIDQLEELVSRSERSAAIRFVDGLFEAMFTNAQVRASGVATLRSDYYPQLLEVHPHGPALLHAAYPVGPLSIDRLAHVIEGPARVVGIRFDQGLVDRIVSDAGSSDALPLLSFVLRAMYERLPHGDRTLTHSLYEGVGELEGALARHAELTYSEISEPAGQALMATLVNHLVTVDAEGKASKRRCSRAELPARSLEGIGSFVDSRLFVASMDEGEPRVEVAHEALFRHWPRLAEAIATESVIVRYIRQAVRQGVADWRQFGTLLGQQHRSLLNEYRDRLMLTPVELELAFRSAVRFFDEADFWLRATLEAGVGQELARTVMKEGDPFSRHNLLMVLGEFVADHPGLAEVVRIAIDSEYPALIRQAQRMTAQPSPLSPTGARDHVPNLVRVEGGDALIGEELATFVSMHGYSIGEFPVTNHEYLQFVQNTNYRRPAHWEHDRVFRQRADYPVVNVSWFDAVEYCKWLSESTDRLYRLPTEYEWEKAASWNPATRQKTKYPWGDQMEVTRCNVRECGVGSTTPIGQYRPHGGDSAYGLSDLAGNVWEWTISLGQQSSGELVRYPDPERVDRLDEGVWGPRVQRGGTFLAGAEFATSTARLVNLPQLALQDFGFRVVMVGTE